MLTRHHSPDLLAISPARRSRPVSFDLGRSRPLSAQLKLSELKAENVFAELRGYSDTRGVSYTKPMGGVLVLLGRPMPKAWPDVRELLTRQTLTELLEFDLDDLAGERRQHVPTVSCVPTSRICAAAVATSPPSPEKPYHSNARNPYLAFVCAVPSRSRPCEHALASTALRSRTCDHAPAITPLRSLAITPLRSAVVQLRRRLASSLRATKGIDLDEMLPGMATPVQAMTRWMLAVRLVMQVAASTRSPSVSLPSPLLCARSPGRVLMPVRSLAPARQVVITIHEENEGAPSEEADAEISAEDIVAELKEAGEV